jgi:hypothetical protein
LCKNYPKCRPTHSLGVILGSSDDLFARVFFNFFLSEFSAWSRF